MLNPHMLLHDANISGAAVGLAISGGFTQLPEVAITRSRTVAASELWEYSMRLKTLFAEWI